MIKLAYSYLLLCCYCGTAKVGDRFTRSAYMASVILSLPFCYLILFSMELIGGIQLSPVGYIIYITITGTSIGLLYSKYFLNDKQNGQVLLTYNRMPEMFRIFLGILGLIFFTIMLLSIVGVGALYFRHISS